MSSESGGVGSWVDGTERRDSDRHGVWVRQGEGAHHEQRLIVGVEGGARTAIRDAPVCVGSKRGGSQKDQWFIMRRVECCECHPSSVLTYGDHLLSK